MENERLDKSCIELAQDNQILVQKLHEYEKDLEMQKRGLES